QSLNPAHAIVMRLDEVCPASAAGFDRIGINRALSENPSPLDVMFRFQDALLHTHELFPYDLALPLREDDAAQGLKELPLCGKYASAHWGKICLEKISLPFAHQSGVHIGSVDSLGPKGFEAKRIGYGRVHAAADEEEDIRITSGRPDLLFQRLNLAGRIPIL